MSINYNLNIPAAANNPSDDQPNMQINTNAINSWTGIDHVDFSGNPAGTHQQVTFSSQNTPGAQSDPSCVLYSATGVASTVSDVKFVNQNGTFLLNSVRAAAIANTGGIVSSQSFNVTSVTRSAAGIYAVVIPANILTGSNYGVVIGIANAAATNNFASYYEISSSTAFNIYFRNSSASLADPVAFTFQVIQM